MNQKRKVDKIVRENDVISGGEIESLYSMDSFPVFIGCSQESEENDIKADMCWHISKDTGMVQLNPVLPLDLVYQEAHGSGCVGDLWLQHHQEFAKFISKQKPMSVLEIGGAHGILSREYMRDHSVDWTILEPNPSPAEGVDVTFVKGFFDDKFSFDAKIDTIIHSHVFEHVYYPNEFVSHISEFLEEGQKVLFSLPNMEEMLKRKYTNCINFEHTVFITEPYIEYLLSKYNFRKIAKQYFKKDHSIFYAYVKDSSVKTINLSGGLYEHNKKLYLDYVNYHKDLIKDLNGKMQQVDSGQSIYLFGAHIFAQYLIAFGLDTSRIVNLLDNDPNKHGKRLYGTKLMVKSPKALAQLENPIVILKAGVYNEEIKADILNNINNSVVFLE
jgi:predicted SAM-dependent methyltransferase